jgi:hypothetical protein
MNEAAILCLITVGFYQASCNLWRVFTTDENSMPPKVGRMRSRGNAPERLAAPAACASLPTWAGCGSASPAHASQSGAVAPCVCGACSCQA